MYRHELSFLIGDSASPVVCPVLGIKMWHVTTTTTTGHLEAIFSESCKCLQYQYVTICTIYLLFAHTDCIVSLGS